jgi:hypothetical protein
VPSIVDPAEGEFRQMDEEVAALRQSLADASDGRARRSIRRQLVTARLRASWRIVRSRWGNRHTPW